MTAKAALCKALLDGHVLTIMSCFKMVGLTNLGREIPRMIEEPFGVTVSRVSISSKSRYGQPVSYTEYRLNNSPHNREGIEKMKEYVAKFNQDITETVKSKQPEHNSIF